MSFFGFDTTLPREKRSHPSTAPGFSIAKDPFAGLPQGNSANGDDVDAINFDDTYDGLGDQLDERDDAFNDDTFGAGGRSQPVDKDFDFFGQTAKVSDAITEELLRYSRQQGPHRPAPSHAAPTNFDTSSSRPTQKSVRSGYEKYRGHEQVSDLQVDPSLWGAPPSTQTVSNLQSRPDAVPRQSSANTGKKMLSLEEVEEQMRAKSKTPIEPQAAVNHPAPFGNSTHHTQTPQQRAFASPAFLSAQAHPSQAPPRHSPLPVEGQQQDFQAEPRSSSAQAPQALPRPPQTTNHLQSGVQPPRPPDAVQRQRMSQTANGLHRPPPGQSMADPRPRARIADHRVITHPQQLMQLSEEERAAYLVEEAKRAKRNHKIFLLSKDNGLMSPQDKNFITRIQLQQLMAASGNADDKDPDAAIAEDFYYQVFSQIRSGPRQNPHQPLSQFAQTYLYQTGSRHGGRRHNRGENHMQRMEQQVQRAVEAAKAKPKNTQLSIEGSLGKIALSNSKAPRAVLSIKRPESGDHTNRQHHAATRSVSHRNVKGEPDASDARTTLRNIEAIYTTLMKIEEDARKEPAPPSPGADSDRVDQHVEWSARMSSLTEQLWRDLKVHEPVDPDSPRAHPFIAILAYPKGKKAIPRAFRFLSPTQRLTTLTIIFLHLDALDVVRDGHIPAGAAQPPSPRAREAIELFSGAVLPSLFAFVSDAPLFSVIGLLGLILDRVRVPAVAGTRVGLAVLTLLTSRATLLRDAAGAAAAGDPEWQQWTHSFDRLFDTVEPVLPSIFPMPINSGEDMYIWQFLAAMGSGASPEQQSRLVIAVKDRVMETVTQSKTLPPDMASQRLGNVNLFMRAIGLDVELLG